MAKVHWLTASELATVETLDCMRIVWCCWAAAFAGVATSQWWAANYIMATVLTLAILLPVWFIVRCTILKRKLLKSCEGRQADAENHY